MFLSTGEKERGDAGALSNTFKLASYWKEIPVLATPFVLTVTCTGPADPEGESTIIWVGLYDLIVAFTVPKKTSRRSV